MRNVNFERLRLSAQATLCASDSAWFENLLRPTSANNGFHEHYWSPETVEQRLLRTQRSFEGLQQYGYALFTYAEKLKAHAILEAPKESKSWTTDAMITQTNGEGSSSNARKGNIVATHSIDRLGTYDPVPAQDDATRHVEPVALAPGLDKMMEKRIKAFALELRDAVIGGADSEGVQALAVLLGTDLGEVMNRGHKRKRTDEGED